MSHTASQSANYYSIEVNHEGRFVVRALDSDRTDGVYDTQAEAVLAAKTLNLSGEKTQIELSESLVYGATRQAERQGVPVLSWISNALEDRIRNEELAERFFRRRAEGDSAQRLGELLDMAANEPPVPGDELLDGMPSH